MPLLRLDLPLVAALDRRLAGVAVTNCAAALEAAAALRLERRYEESELVLLGSAEPRVSA